MTRLLLRLATADLRLWSFGLLIGSALTAAGAYFAQDIVRILLGAATMFLLTGSFTSVGAWVAGENDRDDGPGGSGAHV